MLQKILFKINAVLFNVLFIKVLFSTLIIKNQCFLSSKSAY